MKTLRYAVLAGAIILLSAFTIYKATNWQIKDGYNIKFIGTDVDGNFETIKGDITFDENDLGTSKFNLDVDVTSIATGNWLKNRHAKSEKWFNADKYPNIKLTSTKFSKSTNGYIVDGILEMHGIKKQVSLPFTFSNSIFKSSFSVNRIDYGVGTLEGMSKKVSNEIKIEVTIPVNKK